MKTIEHLVPNGDGWLISLFQTWDEDRIVPGRKPVLIVPGYGMNSFIFSYHPRGLSLEGYLAEAGFEVWRVDLRGQGASRSIGGGESYGLEDLALTDLSVAIRAALERSRTGASRADIIGASLGGTIMFAHAVLERETPIGSLVAIGSPVRWVDVHPAIKIAFAWPTLVGLVRFKGTRKLAAFALPQLAKRTPWLLSIYMNAEITDTSAAAEMVKTGEDPTRHSTRPSARGSGRITEAAVAWSFCRNSPFGAPDSMLGSTRSASACAPASASASAARSRALLVLMKAWTMATAAITSAERPRMSTTARRRRRDMKAPG